MEPSDGQTGFNFAALEDDAPEEAPAPAPADYHPVSGVATLESFDIGFEADDDNAAASAPLPSSAPPIAVDLPPAPPIGMESPAPPLQPNPDDIVARFLEVYKEKISAESFLDTEPLPPEPPSFPPDDANDSTVALPEEFTESDTVVTGAYRAHEERPPAGDSETLPIADDLDRLPRRRRRASHMRETLIDQGDEPAPVAMRPVPLYVEEDDGAPAAPAAPAPGGLLPSTLAWLRRLRGNYGRYKEIGVWPHLWGWLRGSRSRPPRSSIVADAVAANAASAEEAPAPAAPEESLDTVMDILPPAREEAAPPDAPPSAPVPAPGGAPAPDFPSDPEIGDLAASAPSRPGAADEEEDILGLLSVAAAPFAGGGQAGDEEEIGGGEMEGGPSPLAAAAPAPGKAPREPGMIRLTGKPPEIAEPSDEMIKISGNMPETAPRGDGMVKISGKPLAAAPGDGMIKISGKPPLAAEAGDGMVKVSGAFPPLDESLDDVLKVSGAPQEDAQSADAWRKAPGGGAPSDAGGWKKSSSDGGLKSDEDGGWKKSSGDGGLKESDDDGWKKSSSDGGLKSDEDGGWKKSSGDGGLKESGGDGWKKSSGDGGLKSDEGGGGWKKSSGDGWSTSTGDGGAKRGDGDGWKRVPAEEAEAAEEESAPAAGAGGDDLFDGVDVSDSVPLADLTGEESIAAPAAQGAAGALPGGAEGQSGPSGDGGAGAGDDIWGAAAAAIEPASAAGAAHGAAPAADGWDDVDLDMLEAAEAPVAPLAGDEAALEVAPVADPGEAAGEAGATMAVPPIVARLWAFGQALVGAVAGALHGLFKRRPKKAAPAAPAGDASAPLPPVDEDAVIGAAPESAAPVAALDAPAPAASAAPADLAADLADLAAPTVSPVPSPLADLDDILPTSDAAFSGADGDWPDTGSGGAGFTLSGDVSLAGLGGLLGDDDFSMPAPDPDAPPAKGWLVVAAVRAWERLVNAYKAVDRVIDFHKNWWLLVDGVAILIMTVSFAVILAYFLYYR